MLMQYKKEKKKKKTFVQLMRWQKLLLGEDPRKSPLHQDLIPGPVQ